MSVVAVLSRRGLLTLMLACALVAVALPAASRGEEEKKRVTVKDLIAFTWSVSPEDPFSSTNAIPAMPKLFNKADSTAWFSTSGSILVGALPKVFRRGETFFLTIYGKPKDGYHTYPIAHRTPIQQDILTKISYPDSDTFTPLWPLAETEAEFVKEPGTGVLLEHAKPFCWTQEILVKPEAKSGLVVLKVHFDLQACKGSCILGTLDYDIPIIVSADTPLPASPALEAKLKQTPQVDVVPIPDSFKDPPVKPPQLSEMSWHQFILSGVWFGLISLVTPCVFPMIPITVSFFVKQSERKHNSPVLLASVYSGTIVTVLTIGGVLLSTVLVIVSQHWATNLVLGLLFLFFALSLLGMYEIMLPTNLVNFTSAREGQGGLAGTFFMALTFTIISFACVAPFYGSFLVFAASASTTADWLKLMAGALAYSITFASPFFVLALFPTLLRAMPRSGSWMNTIKVVMGFIEVAAAVKFLRSAELAYFLSSSFLTFDLSLGIYIALCILCGLYLLNLYRLPHDHEPLETIGVPRAMTAVAFFALGLYLTPGLFKQPDGNSQRQGGTLYEWIEAFLLPAETKTDLVWSGELQESLKTAQKDNKLIFVDCTAIVCTNCRYNEATVFNRPEIVKLFGRYVLVKLYTDGIPSYMEHADSAAANKRFQTEELHSTQLPLYAILRPSGDTYEIVEIYDEGKINSPARFADFLKRHLPAK